jgi:hypothetical protein
VPALRDAGAMPMTRVEEATIQARF